MYVFTYGLILFYLRMDFRINVKLSKELLLIDHSEEEYMQHYLGIPVKKGLFRSPLRKDKNPTCSFYRNKNNELIFKDFNGSFYGNFINVVMYKYNCSYINALKIIAEDFGIIPSKTNKPIVKKIEVPRFKEKEHSEIQISVQPFSSSELKWWNSYGITKDILEKFKVFSCGVLFLNKVIFSVSSKDCPIYGYYMGKSEGIELWRIYFPKRKLYRFLSNTPSSIIQGLKQLPKTGNVLVITKSMKDVMCLYSLGINAIAPNSEHLFIHKRVLSSLKERFSNIIVLYDNDLTGITNLNKIKRNYPELLYTWLPRNTYKDISDFYKHNGKEETIKLINKWKKINSLKLK